MLRDESYVIIMPANGYVEGVETMLFDLSKDPYQESPVYLYDIADKENVDLIHWGKQAVAFLTKVNEDLLRAHHIGKRCSIVYILSYLC